MELRFVDAENTDLLELAGRLDEYYFSIVGEVHRRYAKYNDPHLFGCRLVVYEDGCAAGCGCWKRTDAHTVELKRIYVRPEYRRRGIAGAVIRALEGRAIRALFWKPRGPQGIRRRFTGNWDTVQCPIMGVRPARKTAFALKRRWGRWIKNGRRFALSM